MTNLTTLFFQLLQVAIGKRDKLEYSPTQNEWAQLFAMAKKQSLAGICFSGVEKLPKEQSPGEDLIMDWMGEKVKIERRNRKINQDVAEAVTWLNSKDFECCLLKGQGNALQYPHPSLRTPGDIDMWIRARKPLSKAQNVKKIIDFVKGRNPDAKACYHHIDGTEINGTEIELHYRPHFMQNFVHNARLQKFFSENADEQFKHYKVIAGKKIAVPSSSFNIIFQISHIYQHLFNEGIGLRQILDYYYVLKSYAESNEKDYVDWSKTLINFGLKGIASAIMWILIQEFEMSNDCAIAPPDEKLGRFVLNEILEGGNFGKYDERNARFGHSKVGKNVQRLYKDVRLIHYFPSEALSEPFFRFWHAVWRYRHN